MPPEDLLRDGVAREGLDFSRRAELSEWMDEPCSREELRACLRDLARVNRWFLAYRPVLQWLDRVARHAERGPLRILDVGCGYGDGLRRIERWARQRGVAVELTGLDLNEDAIAIAAEASGAGSAIRWVAANVFEYQASESVDVVVSSLFTHHLRDDEVVRFVRWMESQAQTGWLINDLSRAPIPYHLFRWFSRAAGLHPFVQHDGPVSFLRAFVADDWRRLCGEAGLTSGEIEIVGYTPARLCVSRRKAR
jgi:SAM-dependent methyltransferase